jgi:hypothetical protein
VSLREKIVPTVKKIVALAYPPTRRKLHHLSHVAGVIFTIVISVLVWFTSRLQLSDKLLADLAFTIALATKWRAIFGKFDTVVIDRLPIPEGDEPEETGSLPSSNEPKGKPQ